MVLALAVSIEAMPRLDWPGSQRLRNIESVGGGNSARIDQSHDGRAPLSGVLLSFQLVVPSGGLRMDPWTSRACTDRKGEPSHGGEINRTNLRIRTPSI
jgi:hypothetical protein